MGKPAILLAFVVAVFGFQEQILRCSYQDGAQINRLYDSLIDVQGVISEGQLDVRVQRESDYETIKAILPDCKVVVDDLGEQTRKFLEINDAARAKYPDFYNVSAGSAFPDWFKSYHTNDEHLQWYQELSRQYPNLVRVVQLTNSTYQNRTINGISIFNYGSGRTPTYRSFHSAGIHAREWISPATAQFMAYQLLNLFTLNNDTIITNWVNNVETRLYASINPDGYAYTWTGTNARQWRKNRNPGPAPSTCIGTDQNRNYNDHWGQGGSSTDPCSDTYMGRSAGSERETNTLVAEFNRVSDIRIILAIDWHSYSQLFLRPYGWTNNVSPDEQRFITLGTNYVNTLRTAFNMNYTSQRSFQLYQTTGSAQDWYYGASNPRGTQRTAAWTIELRPTGSNPGFNLPPEQIIPTGYENWIALRGLFDSVRTNPLP